MIEDEQILKDIKTKATVKIWPHLAKVYDVSRNKAYAIAKEGLESENGEFVRSGRTIRAVTSALRRKLGIDA